MALLLIALAFGGDSIRAQATEGNNVTTSFRAFSSNLVRWSMLDGFSSTYGASVSFPFGVGYMLANINNQVWNVSTDGFENVLKCSRNDITTNYAAILEKLNQKGMSAHNVLYIRDSNSSVTLPERSKNLKTEIKYSNFVSNWSTSWHEINQMVSDYTGGKLDNEFLPKGMTPSMPNGSPFRPYAVAAYINTNHLKLNFEKILKPIGAKLFNDGFSVNFYEAEGRFPFIDTELYSAVAIPLSENTKYVVFALPKKGLRDFIRKDLTSFLELADPTQWPSSDKKIHVPALNLTVFNKYYENLEQLGINRTICAFDHEDESKREEESFFAGSIAQANHIYLSSEFLEIASATGSSVNSGKEVWKLIESGGGDDDYWDESLAKATNVFSRSIDVDAETKFSTVNLNHPIDNHPLTMNTGVSESADQDQDTLQFNKPFFWYVYDKALGPLYYGSVNSFAKYKKAKDDLEMSEEYSWLFDFFKTSLWLCPY